MFGSKVLGSVQKTGENRRNSQCSRSGEGYPVFLDPILRAFPMVETLLYCLSAAGYPLGLARSIPERRFENRQVGLRIATLTERGLRESYGTEIAIGGIAFEKLATAPGRE